MFLLNQEGSRLNWPWTENITSLPYVFCVSKCLSTYRETSCQMSKHGMFVSLRLFRMICLKDGISFFPYHTNVDIVT